eukprot:TRINITY_DN5239_c0_g1_i1.p7 TRINITY_DN5239_c0_g1~~TRINITY_DN5239_c0_g1_i1.p7  ORF type:complete len:103 (+),score=2.19 TRINITY_DN5239_c0_g1_i1:446-754(+)
MRKMQEKQKQESEQIYLLNTMNFISLSLCQHLLKGHALLDKFFYSLIYFYFFSSVQSEKIVTKKILPNLLQKIKNSPHFQRPKRKFNQIYLKSTTSNDSILS